MKKEDFERLKAVCEKEGFEIGGYTPSSRVFVIDKKDIWDGVEFLSVNGFDKIYKIKGISNDVIFVEPDMCFTKSVCKPSTESAYIEQLKKEAHERFGDIKDGDRFINTKNSEVEASKRWNDEYDKDRDLFIYKGVYLYQRGKWATRVKERVKVDIDQKCWAIISKGKQEIELTFLISKPVPCIEAMKTFLASQLEAYLNLDGYSVDVSGETLSIHVKIRNGVDLEDLKEKAESLAKIVKKI